jgi:hypothetical protein
MGEEKTAPRFAIYRARDARPYDETGPMFNSGEMPPVLAQYAPDLHAAGVDAGHHVRLLFSAPGISLTYVWFKSGFPLPRHSHNADCLYYIVAGSLKMGAEDLGPGDGFFLGSDVPYAYTPGPDGLELLEFRTSDRFDFKMLAENPAFWIKAIKEVGQRSPGWIGEPKPTMSAHNRQAGSDERH